MQHWHVCLPWETRWTEMSQKVQPLHFCVKKINKNAQTAEAASDASTCLPVNCFRTCHLVMPCKCLAFILRSEALAAQQRGFIPPEMVLAPGEVYCSQMAASCFLLVGWRNNVIFTPGPDSEGHLICLWMNCNKQGCKSGAHCDRNAWCRIFLTLNSLRRIHLISGDFCTIFGLQVVIPEDFLPTSHVALCGWKTRRSLPNSATTRPKSGMAVEMNKAVM